MDNAAIVDRLRTQGFAVLGAFLTREIEAIREYLFSRPVYLDAHVPQTARNLGHYPVPRSISGASECICVETWDAILAPYMLERALALTDVAAGYLGRDPPVCYSANAFWTRPGPASTRPDIQEFHQDKDDVRFLAMFVYLTNVFTDDDGPQDLFGPDGGMRTIYGQAGTVFLADTSRDHRGRKPTTGERGLAWFRWGISDRPPANEWDKIEPIAAADLGDRYPSDPRLRQSIKLLAG